MKKTLSVILILCMMCLIFAGCGAESSAVILSPEEVANALAQGKVDVDLTALSSTMVYGEVSNMMTNSDNYMGKIIKASGVYATQHFEKTNDNYHYVVIEDAASCCKQGIEFVWSGEHKFPEDYPTKGAEIELVGVYGKYEELGQPYYYLQVNEIKVLSE